MLVTFSTPAHANITMFGDVAVHMLELMGHSATVPGALLSEDIPAALKRLEAAVEADQQLPQPQQSREDDDEEAPVSLAHRALPLIGLLRAAADAKCNVMWDSELHLGT
ncbi:MAG: DUF1840 domain-containing protein [Gammaproteobacteria bacterium]|jgi:hypothetical protein